MENNNKKKSVVVALAILLVASVSFTFAYFTAQLSGDNATNVQVSSKAQTSLIFNKGDDLSLDLGVDNLYDGAGNVTSTTNPSVSLSAPEEVTENYVISFNINTNSFVYTTEEKTPELILTILDENDTPVTSVGGLSYVTQGEVSGFDITEASGLFEILNNGEIIANNNTVTSEWTFTLTFINLDTDQVLNAGKEFGAEIIMDGEGITTNFAERILYFNGGAEAIELKEADLGLTTLTEDKYNSYDDWCTDATYCSIDRATYGEDGVYAIEDTEGTSYYFRGAVDNNWVVFGQEEGKDIYWRIVRIEGNGNIKLIYSGTTAPVADQEVTMLGEGTQLSSGTTTFQNTTLTLEDGELLYQSMEGSGYVYEDDVQHGFNADSLIKTEVDTWYTDNLEILYGDFIAPYEVCIDRTTYTRSGDVWAYEYIKDNLQEITANKVYYGGYSRLTWTIDPTIKFDCDVLEDVITLDVGLISADEVVLAGGGHPTFNTSYYLYTNSSYWTMSPYSFGGTNAFVFNVYSTGYLYYYNASSPYGVRPVISLTSTIDVSSGNGTWNNPYVIET